ncbi:MAG: alpha-glucan family phosphorylase [Planctomycetota bacterium]
MDRPRTIAYFSMEIAVAHEIPTYSGGLGVLAGDTIRSGADLGLPMVGVTLLHRGGYFTQSISADGVQSQEASAWDPAKQLTELDGRATVQIEGREVQIRAWRFDAAGEGGHVVPVLMLDTDLPENSDEDRKLTDRLYGGDDTYRIMQETVLGVGGVRMLEATGYTDVNRYHMNEGHAALLVLELVKREAAMLGKKPTDDAVKAAVREKCIFTTHTPVPAGHDSFTATLAHKVVGSELVSPYLPVPAPAEAAPAKSKKESASPPLNMTHLGLEYSRYVNGVAKRHGEVSRRMFPGHEIDSITNGVHANTWVAPAFAGLFDKYLDGWRHDPAEMRNAMAIPLDEIRSAHAKAKKELIGFVKSSTGVAMDENAFTICFARRATAYKRAHLVLSDPKKLREVAEKAGPVQILYGGKAHPRDTDGQAIIKQIFETAEELGDAVKVAYVQNYEMTPCALMVGGCDLWLNTPRPPLEASGTSGMKAAMNGIPSLSIVDGWWVEGWIEGVTGWSVGEDLYNPDDIPDEGAGEDDPKVVAKRHEKQNAEHADSIYTKLRETIVPMFHNEPDRFAEIMRNSIAINGSFFTTQRMMQEYASRAYLV